MTVPVLSLLLVVAAQTPFDLAPLRPERGPELVTHASPGPLVALRLSAPVDPALPEGGIELLQELARPEAAREAARYGARLAFRNDGSHAVLAVTGPVAAFDALAALLRSATTELDLSVANLRRARARAEDRVLAALERPEPRVWRLLRHELFGGSVPAGAAATALSPEEIRRLRRQVYHPDRVRVTVVGRIPEPVLRSAFTGWAPHSPADEATALPMPEPPEPARPQAHREWAGLGYRLEADPAVLAVAAELVQRRLDASPLRRGAARVWRGPTDWALVLAGATEPGDTVVRTTAGIGALLVEGAGPSEDATGVGRYLRRMVAEAAALAGEAALADARARVRRLIFVEARTVTGRAELLGRLSDTVGPAQVVPFLDGLERVELEQVLAVLGDILAMPAVYVEAR